MIFARFPAWQPCATARADKHAGLPGRLKHRLRPLNLPAPARLLCGAIREHDDGGLSAEFASFVLQTGHATHQSRGPSPLLPPHEVVRQQMNGLQRNDYPMEESGVDLAYAFAMPEGLQNMKEGQVAETTGRRRSWLAAESWLTQSQFRSLLHQAPYNVMLGCYDWKAGSSVVFTGSRTSSRAVQVVHVHATSPTTSESDSLPATANRMFTFSFCMQQIESGAQKGIWYTVGVRVGDYSGLPGATDAEANTPATMNSTVLAPCLQESDVEDLEMLLLKGNFSNAADACRDWIGQLQSLDASLATRMMFVAVQSSWITGRHQELMKQLEDCHGGLQNMPLQVFTLWQVIQLEAGSSQTCRQQLEQRLSQLANQLRCQPIPSTDDLQVTDSNSWHTPVSNSGLMQAPQRIHAAKDDDYRLQSHSAVECNTETCQRTHVQDFEQLRPHVLAICRLYTVDVLSDSLKQYDEAEAFLESETAKCLLKDEQLIELQLAITAAKATSGLTSSQDMTDSQVPTIDGQSQLGGLAAYAADGHMMMMGDVIDDVHDNSHQRASKGAKKQQQNRQQQQQPPSTETDGKGLWYSGILQSVLNTFSSKSLQSSQQQEQRPGEANRHPAIVQAQPVNKECQAGTITAMQEDSMTHTAGQEIQPSSQHTTEPSPTQPSLPEKRHDQAGGTYSRQTTPLSQWLSSKSLAVYQLLQQSWLSGGQVADAIKALFIALLLFAVYREWKAIRRALQRPMLAARSQATDLLRMAFALSPNPMASGYMPRQQQRR